MEGECEVRKVKVEIVGKEGGRGLNYGLGSMDATRV